MAQWCVIAAVKQEQDNIMGHSIVSKYKGDGTFVKQMGCAHVQCMTKWKIPDQGIQRLLMYDILSLANGLQTDQEQRSYTKMTHQASKDKMASNPIYTQF